MAGQVEIRSAAIEDAEALLGIYAPYVMETAITFEYDVPSVAEFRERIASVLRRYPYLVAVTDNTILGYAYAGAFVGRKAYEWSAELSVYVDRERRKSGIGGKLYRALEAALKDMGILNLYACIGYPEREDEYLTRNSVHFHEHLGFKLVGHFHQCGYKFNRWYDMVWMEKIIEEHGKNVLPVSLRRSSV
ncbi:MAG: N-acetyltransferase [Synergistaceae bacterium]|nr:N-acetyltransferase [Synergistaceae bacterium]